MRFDIYCDANKKQLIRKNVSKEDVIKYLKSLTIIEKSHIYLEPVKEVIDFKKEDEYEKI